MKRPAFFSFHFDNDIWRANQVRNIGVVDGNQPVSGNEWEAVKRGGDRAIMNWIEDQLKYKQILIVLIGSETASRPWVLYEIKHAWALGKPIMGIRINALEDASGRQSRVGQNPFEKIWLDNGTLMSQWVPVFTPNPYGTSRDAYNDIRINMGTWVESAIVAQRNLRRMPLV